MTAAPGTDSWEICQPRRLAARARDLLRERGWEWPADGLTLATAIEDLLVPDFVRALQPARLREIVENCVRVVTGRTGLPEAFSEPYPGEGVLVVLDGSLLLMFADVLGHALSLVTATVTGSQVRYTVDPPAADTTYALASVITAFFRPERGLDLHHLPTVPATGLAGQPALGKFLEAGERFIVGHEIAHALIMLGQLGEAPGIRDLVSSSAELSRSSTDNWVAELSADVFAVGVVGAAAGRLPGQRDVALAGCLLALEHAALLERIAITASSVPWPPDPAHPPDFTAMRTHPPAGLRLHVAGAVAGEAAAELAEPYRVAVVALLDGISEASAGTCMATLPEAGRWCTEARAQTGWYCPAHAARVPV